MRHGRGVKHLLSWRWVCWRSNSWCCPRPVSFLRINASSVVTPKRRLPCSFEWGSRQYL